MSIPALLIKYAVDSCTSSHVQEVFEHIFEEAIVKNVVQLNRIDSRNGRPYKMFFIYFSSYNQKLRDFIQGTALAGGTQTVLYDDPYYWKVVIAEPRTLNPRVLSHEEKLARKIN